MKNYFAVICLWGSLCESILTAGRTKEYELSSSSLSNFASVRGFYSHYIMHGDTENIVALYQHVDKSAERRKIVIPSYEPVPYELLSLVLDHEGMYQPGDVQAKITISDLIAKAEKDTRILNAQIDLADHLRFTQDKVFVASALFSAAAYCKNRPSYSIVGVLLSGYSFYKSYQNSLERLVCNTERDALQRLVDDCRALSGTQAKKSADAQKIVITFPDYGDVC